MARLIIESGPNKGMIFPISMAPCSIGRLASNDLQVVDKRISRRHAEIFLKDGAFYVKDLKSKNGTHVNDILITEPYKLSDEDVLRVGDTALVFESEHEGSKAAEKKEKPATEITSHSVHVIADEGWTESEELYAPDGDPYLSVKKKEQPEGYDPSNKLAILYQIADSIRSILDLDELLEVVMEIVIRVIKADIGLLLLFEGGRNDLVPRVLRAKDIETTEITISESIVDRSVKQRISILVSDAPTDRRFMSSKSIVSQKIRSALCVPLVCKDEVFGVIYLDNRVGIVPFTNDDLELLTSIGIQSALAISNAKMHLQIVEQHSLEKEMEIARSIQRNVLPDKCPKIPSFEVAALNVPARRVGGDFYDFISVAEEEWGMVIADVSGKGVPAALLISTVRAQLRAHTGNLKSIEEIISSTNKAVFRETADNMFVAIIYGVLNSRTGDFEYVNAGHIYPLLFKKKKDYSCEELIHGGCFLGIDEDTRYEPGKVKLRKGDILLLFTDGITDAQNREGEFYGMENLKALVRKHSLLSAEDLSAEIHDNVKKFMGGADQFDDLTLIVVKAV